MQWEKRGHIFSVKGDRWWNKSHASLPTVLRLDEEHLRVFYGTRDERGRSFTSFFDCLVREPSRITYVHDRPILDLGEAGTFDDSGIMPSCILRVGDSYRLYYIGWNPQVTVSYRLSIGLAISDDGMNFTKQFAGPISDRSVREPFFNTAPHVMFNDGIFTMWFISCTGWHIINGKMEPQYHVCYQESPDGIEWMGERTVAIEYAHCREAIGRPFVIREGETYRMWYSYRSLDDYRTDRTRAYKIGYAESSDGRRWIRRDDRVGIGLSDDGWDNTMMEYCSILPDRDCYYMFYNGNGFGQTGIGYAVARR